MKALRKMILGETWTVPIGVALILVVGLLLRDQGSWVAFVLLAGVVITLSASLRRVP